MSIVKLTVPDALRLTRIEKLECGFLMTFLGCDPIRLTLPPSERKWESTSILTQGGNRELTFMATGAKRPKEPSLHDFIDFMESKLNAQRDAVDECARELRSDFDAMLASNREMDQDFLDRYNREVDKIKKLRWQHMGYERAIEWANDFLKNQTEQK